jgi:hypothetical protein
MNDELRVRQIGPFAFWGRKGEYMMEVADRLVVGYLSKGVSFGYRRRDLFTGLSRCMKCVHYLTAARDPLSMSESFPWVTTGCA